MKLILSFFLLSSVALAGSNQSLTYQGQITRPDGTVLNTGTVPFTLSIYSPGTSKCLLYSETHNLNMTGSDGNFSLQIGLGSRTDGGLHTFDKVFVNGGTLSSLICADASTSYSPSATDDRSLEVSFNDGGTAVSFSAISIKSVAYAMQAQQIGGYGVNDIVKVHPTTGSPTTLTIAEMTKIRGIGAAACANNEILKWNGTVWACSSDDTGAGADADYGSKGSISFLADAATSGINISAGVASLNTGTSSNQIVKLDGSAKLPALDGSNLTNLSASNIASGVLPIARGGTGTGSLAPNRLIGTNGSGSAQDIVSCGLNQVISFDISGNYGCQNIATIYNGFLNGGNTVSAMAVLGTDSSHGLQFETSGTPRMTILSDGKIGVGTTNPTVDFHLQSNSITGLIGMTTSSQNFGVVNSGGTNFEVRAYDSTFTSYSGYLSLNRQAQLTLNLPLGVNSATPDLNLTSSAGYARMIGVGRTTFNNGANLTVQAGGAKSGATDMVGGDLILSSGIATGAASSKLEFRTAAAGPAGTADRAPATKMTILGDGKVGIGISNPITPLHIHNTVGDSEIKVTTAATGMASSDGLGVGINGTGAWVWSYENSPLTLATNNTERMAIHGNGDIGIGIGNTVPGGKLHVNGLVRVTGEVIVDDDDSTSRMTFSQQNVQLYGAPTLNLAGSQNYTHPNGFDDLGVISFMNNTSWNQSSKIVGRATENHSNTATGGRLLFYTTPNTTATPQERVVIDQDGSVGIGLGADGDPSHTLHVGGTLRYLASLEGAAAAANSGASYPIPDLTRNVVRVTLTANTTIGLLGTSGMQPDTVYNLIVRVRQDGVGTRTVSWSAGANAIRWSGGGASPSAAVGAGAFTIYQFRIFAGESEWFATRVFNDN